MHVFTHFTPPVVVFLSAFGALVMCVLFLRAGLPSLRAASAVSKPPHDLTATRFGLAFAAACFVIIATLGVIGLLQQAQAARLARISQQELGPKLAELREQLQGLDARLTTAESRLGTVEARAESAEGSASRVGDRVSGLDRRLTDSQTALRQLSGEVARVQGSVRQIDRNAAADATRAAVPRRGAAVIEPTRTAPRAVPHPPASLSSAPSASPPTELSRAQSDVRVTPETTGPSMPPAPTIARPSASAPPSAPPPASDREDRLAPPSTPASKRDLRTKMQDDWEAMKRDARTTGNEIKDAFRKFRDWIAP